MPKIIPEDLKREIQNAIREHLAIEGPRNWDTLIAQYDISRPTFFKYVKEVQGIAGSDASPGLLRLAKKQIKKVVTEIEDAKSEVVRHLPATPSPNIIAAKGERAMVNIDFMTRLESLYQDAEMVRAYAITMDEAGREKIKNPAFFVNSIKQRRELLETGLKAMQEVYDLNKLQDMQRAIIAVIENASPEMQVEIIEKLRELNSRYGMTVEAKL